MDCELLLPKVISTLTVCYSTEWHSLHQRNPTFVIKCMDMWSCLQEVSKGFKRPKRRLGAGIWRMTLSILTRQFFGEAFLAYNWQRHQIGDPEAASRADNDTKKSVVPCSYCNEIKSRRISVRQPCVRWHCCTMLILQWDRYLYQGHSPKFQFAWLCYQRRRLEEEVPEVEQGQWKPE